MIGQDMIQNEVVEQPQAHAQTDAGQAGDKHFRRLPEKIRLCGQPGDGIGCHRHLMHGDQRTDHADVRADRAEYRQQGGHHGVPLLEACQCRGQLTAFVDRLGEEHQAGHGNAYEHGGQQQNAPSHRPDGFEQAGYRQVDRR